MNKPYLIQRGVIISPLADPNIRLSQAVDLDYMGSAEFEFGAVPASFRRIEKVADDWKMRTCLSFAGGKEALHVWGAFDSEITFQDYLGFLIDIRTKNSIRLEGRSEFDLSSIEFRKKMGWQSPQTDFWWDIQNDVMWTFHKEASKRVVSWVASSIGYMNSQKT